MSDMIQNFFKEAEKEINSQTENEYDEVWDKKQVSIEEVFNNDENNENIENEEVKNNNEQDTLGSQTENNNTIPNTDVQTEQSENKEINNFDKEKFITLTKPLKYRGKEIYPESEEELIELAQKGLDYSFKMNKISQYRELIDFVVKNNISLEDIKNKFENSNSNEEEQYYDDMFEFENNQINDFDISKKIINQIKKTNPVLANKISSIYNLIDDTFKIELNDERLFNAFVGSVANGEFEKIYDNVVKFKAKNPFMTWIEAYSNVANGIKQKEPTEPTEPIQDTYNKKERKVNKNKSIEEQYSEIWEKDLTINELEKMLIEGV